MNPISVWFGSLRRACAAGLAAAAVMLAAPAAVAGVKWEGKVPALAQKAETWHQLMRELSEQSLYYGELAAAQRVLALFTDLSTKELAYNAVIDVIDRGYSFPVRAVFISGDLEPRPNTEQAKSYYLYKGMLNLLKGLEKWGKYYLAKIEGSDFAKYDFYQALQLYQAGDLGGAEELLKKILKGDYPLDRAPFVRKVARTLARIHFERKQYLDALEIYEGFLLRLNPVTPSDWLETAWNLYYLKRFDEALGYLYNLESKSTGPGIDLEKYVLRALIYRDMCDPAMMAHLLRRFSTRFGTTVARIKNGETLTRLGQLNALVIPENMEQYARFIARRELRLERAQLGRLSAKVRPLAEYVYEAELRMLEQVIRMHEETALRKAADYLVTLQENLRFLKFDVAREKYNPDVVFQDDGEDRVTPARTGTVTPESFTLYWRQAGDYWRDERLNYRGVVRNQCASY